MSGIDDDDPLFHSEVKKEEIIKVIEPLSENDITEYTNLFFRFLNQTESNPTAIYKAGSKEDQNISTFKLEDMMRLTPFTLHDDPEEVSKHEIMIDPDAKGTFSLE